MKKTIHLFSFCMSLLASLVVSCQQPTKSAVVTLCTAEQFETNMKKYGERNILDVRTPEEFSQGFISGAILYNIYDSDFAVRVEKLDKKTPVFVYCKGGGRSGQAADQLASMGFQTIYDLKGGVMGWENSGRKLVTGNSVPEKKVEIKKFHLYNKSSLDSLIATGKPLLVNFYAKWCAPCKKMDPVLEKIRNESPDNNFIYRVDVDDAKELCKTLKIEGPPVVKLFKNGKEFFSVNGYQDEAQLRDLINKLK